MEGWFKFWKPIALHVYSCHFSSQTYCGRLTELCQRLHEEQYYQTSKMNIMWLFWTIIYSCFSQTIKCMLAPTCLVSMSRYLCVAKRVFHSLKVLQPPPGHMAKISTANTPTKQQQFIFKVDYWVKRRMWNTGSKYPQHWQQVINSCRDT